MSRGQPQGGPLRDPPTGSRAGSAFTEQGRRLYRMWLREPMRTKPWIEKGAEYGARWDELMPTALGRLADDDEALAVLRAVIDPEFFDNVRAGKRSTDEASALVTAVVVPWFTARRATKPERVARARLVASEHRGGALVHR